MKPDLRSNYLASKEYLDALKLVSSRNNMKNRNQHVTPESLLKEKQLKINQLKVHRQKQLKTKLMFEKLRMKTNKHAAFIPEYGYLNSDDLKSRDLKSVLADIKNKQVINQMMNQKITNKEIEYATIDGEEIPVNLLTKEEKKLYEKPNDVVDALKKMNDETKYANELNVENSKLNELSSLLTVEGKQLILSDKFSRNDVDDVKTLNEYIKHQLSNPAFQQYIKKETQQKEELKIYREQKEEQEKESRDATIDSLSLSPIVKKLDLSESVYETPKGTTPKGTTPEIPKVIELKSTIPSHKELNKMDEPEIKKLIEEFGIIPSSEKKEDLINIADRLRTGHVIPDHLVKTKLEAKLDMKLTPGTPSIAVPIVAPIVAPIAAPIAVPIAVPIVEPIIAPIALPEKNIKKLESWTEVTELGYGPRLFRALDERNIQYKDKSGKEPTDKKVLSKLRSELWASEKAQKQAQEFAQEQAKLQVHQEQQQVQLEGQKKTQKQALEKQQELARQQQELARQQQQVLIRSKIYEHMTSKNANTEEFRTYLRPFKFTELVKPINMTKTDYILEALKKSNVPLDPTKIYKHGELKAIYKGEENLRRFKDAFSRQEQEQARMAKEELAREERIAQKLKFEIASPKVKPFRQEPSELRRSERNATHKGIYYESPL